MQLSTTTPTDALCAAWGATREYVDAHKSADTPISIREAGALAELHGLRLEDILPV